MKRSNASTTHQDIKTAGDNIGEGKAVGKGPAGEPAVAKWVVPSFFFTDDWRLGLFVENVPLDTLMTMRLLCKDWRRAVDKFMDGMIESGVMIVIGGNDIGWKEAFAQRERRGFLTQVVFLLNITKVGDRACKYASILVVVEIPEGVEYIGWGAFRDCSSLTTVSFPTTLKSIGRVAFNRCSSLDNVDLLHTQLQEICDSAFYDCSELKSMTIPESLQSVGRYVFNNCSKLVPAYIDTNDRENNTVATLGVIAHLRSLQPNP
ncbi:hypothetical protein TrVE_jg12540 [Triparma verrucosa]|uniref:Uncharacterized protein n=1 Tax=Triparma verrucosa TaxID=1606542 RepID=A0A9W7FH03_9STRA|nr:hypothetical protein TrVE_jg12540 [Triparma verrucosa]